jgi:copper transport protein
MRAAQHRRPAISRRDSLQAVLPRARLAAMGASKYAGTVAAAVLARLATRARRTLLIALALLAGGLALPASAVAHAYLVKTVPAASVVLNAPPPNIQLTYDEAVEPRLAIISVTNTEGEQETTGPVRRSPANPDTLVVPLRPQLPEGWYLIFWRAISVDGHPVSGAFTYAVGPNPGPAP